MDEGFLKYENSQVHFHRFGQGERLLIALHGFADQASIFLQLEESLTEEYLVYCIDLPFHGDTKWDKSYFDRRDIGEIFKIILEKENKSRFELMGFSMGGRIVLKALLDWIPQVEKVYLIAPDGLKTKGMFNANLIPNWCKKLLKNLLDKPDWFIKMAERFYRWGVIDRFLYNFVNYHIRTNENRNRLFCTWHSLSHFLISVRKTKKLLNNHPISVKMYFGTRDKVIPLSAGKRLSRDLRNVEIYQIEASHRLISKKLNALLKEQLA